MLLIVLLDVPSTLRKCCSSASWLSRAADVAGASCGTVGGAKVFVCADNNNNGDDEDDGESADSCAVVVAGCGGEVVSALSNDSDADAGFGAALAPAATESSRELIVVTRSVLMMMNLVAVQTTRERGGHIN